MTAGLPFAGAAGHYARFRPAYPDELLDALLQRTGSTRQLLVDLGCGTGEVALPLARHFSQVVAADVDPGMIAEAERKARAEGADNITWLVSRAEDLDLPASCDLITAAGAFHWMDRDVLAARFRAALAPGGCVGILGADAAPWEASEEWHEVATASIQRRLGQQRFAGSSTDALQREHTDALVRAGFRVDRLERHEAQRWTVDEYIGYLHSTSFAGVEVLGEQTEAFDAELRRELRRFVSDGLLTEQRRYYALIAHPA